MLRLITPLNCHVIGNWNDWFADGISSVWPKAIGCINKYFARESLYLGADQNSGRFERSGSGPVQLTLTGTVLGISIFLLQNRFPSFSLSLLRNVPIVPTWNF